MVFRKIKLPKGDYSWDALFLSGDSKLSVKQIFITITGLVFSNSLNVLSYNCLTKPKKAGLVSPESAFRPSNSFAGQISEFVRLVCL